MSAQSLDYRYDDDPDYDDRRTPVYWQAQAACAETNWANYTDAAHDPEAFFPKRMEGGQCAPAKSLCLQCPVRVACLQAGMRESTGVWGGLSEKERRTAQKLDRNGQTAEEILAWFDSRQPIRRRKTILRSVEDHDAQAIALTGKVIEQFMSTIGTLPVGVGEGRGLADGPILPATTSAMTPVMSREVAREAERRKNGL